MEDLRFHSYQPVVTQELEHWADTILTHAAAGQRAAAEMQRTLDLANYSCRMNGRSLYLSVQAHDRQNSVGNPQSFVEWERLEDDMQKAFDIAAKRIREETRRTKVARRLDSQSNLVAKKPSNTRGRRPKASPPEEPLERSTGSSSRNYAANVGIAERAQNSSPSIPIAQYHWDNPPPDCHIQLQQATSSHHGHENNAGDHVHCNSADFDTLTSLQIHTSPMTPFPNLIRHEWNVPSRANSAWEEVYSPSSTAVDYFDQSRPSSTETAVQPLDPNPTSFYALNSHCQQSHANDFYPRNASAASETNYYGAPEVEAEYLQSGINTEFSQQGVEPGVIYQRKPIYPIYAQRLHKREGIFTYFVLAGLPSQPLCFIDGDGGSFR